MLFALHIADDGSRESIAMPKIFNSCSDVMQLCTITHQHVWDLKLRFDCQVTSFC